MNDSSYPRALLPWLHRALRVMPVVVVTGARQTGKSTLVRGLTAREYLSLDDMDVLERAVQEPASLLRSGQRITLDEVQRAPGLLLALKRAVDAQRTKGRFVLTGSANLLLMHAASDSLAGRASWLRLYPMTRQEQLGRGSTGCWPDLLEAPESRWVSVLDARGGEEESWHDLARRGGYPDPAVHLTTEADRAIWFHGYLQSWIERDVRDLASISSVIDFRRLAQAACLRLGNLVNQADLARDAGLSPATAHRWLDLMEVSCHLVRLPAFAVNRTKRLIKAPKLYWSDVGLAIHLNAEDEPRGAHLENLVLLDLLAWSATVGEQARISHWRTSSGDEVDFVVEWKGRLLPVEVKSGARPRLDDARGLHAFCAEHAKASRAGLLLHGGTGTAWLSERVLAVPWWRVM